MILWNSRNAPLLLTKFTSAYCRWWLFCHRVKLWTALGVTWLVIVSRFLSKCIEIYGETISKLRFLSCVMQLHTTFLRCQIYLRYVLLTHELIIAFIFIIVFELIRYSICVKKVSSWLFARGFCHFKVIIFQVVIWSWATEFMDLDIFYFCFYAAKLFFRWAE